MPEVDLPEDGELWLGGVVLSGRRAYTEGLFGGGRLVAWVTDGRVPDAGRVWQELSDLGALPEHENLCGVVRPDFYHWSGIGSVAAL
jgi:hypothetical protein